MTVGSTVPCKCPDEIGSRGEDVCLSSGLLSSSSNSPSTTVIGSRRNSPSLLSFFFHRPPSPTGTSRSTLLFPGDTKSLPFTLPRLSLEGFGRARNPSYEVGEGQAGDQRLSPRPSALRTPTRTATEDTSDSLDYCRDPRGGSQRQRGYRERVPSRRYCLDSKQGLRLPSFYVRQRVSSSAEVCRDYSLVFMSEP